MVLKFHLILIDEVPSTQLQFNVLLGNHSGELRCLGFLFVFLFFCFLPLGVQTVSQKTLCLKLR